jgi:hypothetical protein
VAGVVVATLVLSGAFSSKPRETGGSPPPAAPPSATPVPPPPLSPDPVEPPEGVLATVSRTCGADGRSDCIVSLRTGPSGNTTERRRLKEGSRVRVVCQRHGQRAESSVLGGSSDIWARTPAGLYLANVYLDGKGLDPYEITLPVC